MVAQDTARLALTLPIPCKPLESRGAGDWQAIENKLSLRLPGDYKWFIDNYGTGCVGLFLWIFNPFSENEDLNLAAQVESICQMYRENRQETDEEEDCPHPIYPEPGGVVPFGITDNGDVLFWLAEGEDPRGWPVVVNASRSSSYELHAKSMAAFIVGLVSGETTSTIIESDFIDHDNLFLPHDEVGY